MLIPAGLLAVTGLIVLTDMGQLLRIGKRTVAAYFHHHNWFIGVSTLVFVAAVFLSAGDNALPVWVIWLFAVFLLAYFVGTKYLVPYVLFRSKQGNSVYKPARDDSLEGYLAPDDLVYVVEHGGVTRAVPPKYLWVSHIFGGDFGGQEVVLTNLSVPYRPLLTRS